MPASPAAPSESLSPTTAAKGPNPREPKAPNSLVVEAARFDEWEERAKAFLDDPGALEEFIFLHDLILLQRQAYTLAASPFNDEALAAGKDFQHNADILLTSLEKLREKGNAGKTGYKPRTLSRPDAGRTQRSVGPSQSELEAGETDPDVE